MVPNGFGRVKTIFSIFPRKIGLLRTSLDFSGPRYGGRCEIRTHEDLATLPVFKTGAFNRSANLPAREINYLRHDTFRATGTCIPIASASGFERRQPRILGYSERAFE